MSTRRDFVKQTALAAAVLPFRRRLDFNQEKPAKPLRMLVLGGTNLIGPHQIRYAVERGHRVAVFNRGQHQADLPASVEHLVGDRDQPNGLSRGATCRRGCRRIRSAPSASTGH